MPFDSTQFDYTKVQPVYDKDNPPKRMSEALRLAVSDLVEAEQSPIHVVNMEYFHTQLDGFCHVCFAGSVIASTLEADPTTNTDERRFGYEWRQVFMFLDAVRDGDIEEAKRRFHGGGSDYYGGKNTLGITKYHEDPDQFKTDMLDLADLLESEGN